MKPLKIFLRSTAIILIQCLLLEHVSYAADEIRLTVEPHFNSQKIPDLKLPQSVARIDESWKAPGSSSDLIYLIADAHTNDSGQINLAKTLEVLLKQDPKIKYVFSEAGSGDNSLSYMRSYAPLEKRERVARSYIRKGLLHGAEYLDLTLDHPFLLWGVEDLSLYGQALSSYRRSIKYREELTAYLERIRQTAMILKINIFNPSLSLFYEKYELAQDGKAPITEYFSFLSDEAAVQNVSLTDYPNLKKLKDLTVKEAAVDFVKANEEQTKAIQSLNEKDRSELLELAAKERSPEKFYSLENKEVEGFYALLEEKLNGNGNGYEARIVERLGTRQEPLPLPLPKLAPLPLPKDVYPELFKYLSYLKTARQINPAEILSEKERLEKAILDTLVLNDDERRLVNAFRSLRILKNLLELKLISAEYGDYKANKADHDIMKITGFLNEKIMESRKNYERAVFLDPNFSPTIRHCERFYELAYRRDEKFVENMRKKLTENGQKKAVLITGGYHTANLKQLLRAKGISYVSITPQILNETNQERYEKILLSQNLAEAMKLSQNPVPMNRAILPAASGLMTLAARLADGGHFTDQIIGELGSGEKPFKNISAARMSRAVSPYALLLRRLNPSVPKKLIGDAALQSKGQRDPGLYLRLFELIKEWKGRSVAVALFGPGVTHESLDDLLTEGNNKFSPQAIEVLAVLKHEHHGPIELTVVDQDPYVIEKASYPEHYLFYHPSWETKYPLLAEMLQDILFSFRDRTAEELRSVTYLDVDEEHPDLASQKASVFQMDAERLLEHVRLGGFEASFEDIQNYGEGVLDLAIATQSLKYAFQSLETKDLDDRLLILAKIILALKPNGHLIVDKDSLRRIFEPKDSDRVMSIDEVYHLIKLLSEKYGLNVQVADSSDSFIVDLVRTSSKVSRKRIFPINVDQPKAVAARLAGDQSVEIVESPKTSVALKVSHVAHGINKWLYPISLAQIGLDFSFSLFNWTEVLVSFIQTRVYPIFPGLADLLHSFILLEDHSLALGYATAAFSFKGSGLSAYWSYALSLIFLGLLLDPTHMATFDRQSFIVRSLGATIALLMNRLSADYRQTLPKDAEEKEGARLSSSRLNFTGPLTHVGFIGVGTHGMRLLKSALELPGYEGINFKLSAETRFKDIQDEFGNNSRVELKESLETGDTSFVLNDPNVQAVVIAVPAKDHYEIVKEAFEKRKHVFVEKPFVLKADQARELVALAKKYNLILMVGHQFLYAPLFREFSSKVRSGQLGKILSAEAFFLNVPRDPPIELSSDAFEDLGYHDLYMLIDMFGVPTEILEAKRSTNRESIELKVLFGNTPVTLKISREHKRKAMRMLTVRGEKSTAIYDHSDPNRLIISPNAPKIDETRPLGPEMRAFFDAVNSRRAPPSSGESAVPVVAFIEWANKLLDDSTSDNISSPRVFPYTTWTPNKLKTTQSQKRKRVEVGLHTKNGQPLFQKEDMVAPFSKIVLREGYFVTLEADTIDELARLRQNPSLNHEVFGFFPGDGQALALDAAKNGADVIYLLGDHAKHKTAIQRLKAGHPGVKISLEVQVDKNESSDSMIQKIDLAIENGADEVLLKPYRKWVKDDEAGGYWQQWIGPDVLEEVSLRMHEEDPDFILGVAGGVTEENMRKVFALSAGNLMAFVSVKEDTLGAFEERVGKYSSTINSWNAENFEGDFWSVWPYWKLNGPKILEKIRKKIGFGAEIIDIEINGEYFSEKTLRDVPEFPGIATLFVDVMYYPALNNRSNVENGPSSARLAADQGATALPDADGEVRRLLREHSGIPIIGQSKADSNGSGSAAALISVRSNIGAVNYSARIFNKANLKAKPVIELESGQVINIYGINSISFRRRTVDVGSDPIIFLSSLGHKYGLTGEDILLISFQEKAVLNGAKLSSRIREMADLKKSIERVRLFFKHLTDKILEYSLKQEPAALEKAKGLPFEFLSENNRLKQLVDKFLELKLEENEAENSYVDIYRSAREGGILLQFKAENGSSRPSQVFSIQSPQDLVQAFIKNSSLIGVHILSSPSSYVVLTRNGAQRTVRFDDIGYLADSIRFLAELEGNQHSKDIRTLDSERYDWFISKLPDLDPLDNNSKGERVHELIRKADDSIYDYLHELARSENAVPSLMTASAVAQAALLSGGGGLAAGYFNRELTDEKILQARRSGLVQFLLASGDMEKAKEYLRIIHSRYLFAFKNRPNEFNKLFDEMAGFAGARLTGSNELKVDYRGVPWLQRERISSGFSDKKVKMGIYIDGITKTLRPANQKQLISLEGRILKAYRSDTSASFVEIKMSKNALPKKFNITRTENGRIFFIEEGMENEVQPVSQMLKKILAENTIDVSVLPEYFIVAVADKIVSTADSGNELYGFPTAFKNNTLFVGKTVLNTAEAMNQKVYGNKVGGGALFLELILSRVVKDQYKKALDASDERSAVIEDARKYFRLSGEYNVDRFEWQDYLRKGAFSEGFLSEVSRLAETVGIDEVIERIFSESPFTPKPRDGMIRFNPASMSPDLIAKALLEWKDAGYWMAIEWKDKEGQYKSVTGVIDSYDEKGVTLDLDPVRKNTGAAKETVYFSDLKRAIVGLNQPDYSRFDKAIRALHYPRASDDEKMLAAIDIGQPKYKESPVAAPALGYALQHTRSDELKIWIAVALRRLGAMNRETEEEFKEIIRTTSNEDLRSEAIETLSQTDLVNHSNKYLSSLSQSISPYISPAVEQAYDRLRAVIAGNSDRHAPSWAYYRSLETEHRKQVDQSLAKAYSVLSLIFSTKDALAILLVIARFAGPVTGYALSELPRLVLILRYGVDISPEMISSILIQLAKNSDAHTADAYRILSDVALKMKGSGISSEDILDLMASCINHSGAMSYKALSELPFAMEHVLRGLPDSVKKYIILNINKNSKEYSGESLHNLKYLIQAWRKIDGPPAELIVDLIVGISETAGEMAAEFYSSKWAHEFFEDKDLSQTEDLKADFFEGLNGRLSRIRRPDYSKYPNLKKKLHEVRDALIEHNYFRQEKILNNITEVIINDLPGESEGRTFQQTASLAYDDFITLLQRFFSEEEFDETKQPLNFPSLEPKFLRIILQESSDDAEFQLSEERFRKLLDLAVNHEVSMKTVAGFIRGNHKLFSIFTEALDRFLPEDKNIMNPKVRYVKQDSAGLEEFIALLGDRNEFKKLMLAMSVLRLAYPYSLSMGSELTPLEFAREHGLEFQYNDFIKIIPVTQSFRRHVLSVKTSSGQWRDLEIKIPGEREERSTLRNTHYNIAREFFAKVKDAPKKSARPIALVNAGFGTFPFYEGIIEFKRGNDPMKVVIFDDDDGQRLANYQITDDGYHDSTRMNFSPLYLDRVAKNKGITREELELDIAKQVIHIARDLLDMGYLGVSDNVSDWHLENFRLLPDGTVKLVNDFNAFFVDRSSKEEKVEAIKQLIEPWTLTFKIDFLSTYWGVMMDRVIQMGAASVAAARLAQSSKVNAKGGHFAVFKAAAMTLELRTRLFQVYASNKWQNLRRSLTWYFYLSPKIRKEPKANTHAHPATSLSIKGLSKLYGQNKETRKIFRTLFPFDPRNMRKLRQMIMLKAKEGAPDPLQPLVHKNAYPLSWLLRVNPEAHEDLFGLLIKESYRAGSSLTFYTSTFSASDRSPQDFEYVVRKSIHGMSRGEKDLNGKMEGALFLTCKKTEPIEKTLENIWKWKNVRDELKAVGNEEASRKIYGVDFADLESWQLLNDPRFDEMIESIHKEGFVIAFHVGESWKKGKLLRTLKQVEKVVDTGRISFLTNANALWVDPESLGPIYSEDEKNEIRATQQRIYEKIVKNGILVNLSPSSNTRTLGNLPDKGVRFKSIRQLLEQGLLLVATDDTAAIYNTDEHEEFHRLFMGKTVFGPTSAEDLMTLIRNSRVAIEKYRLNSSSGARLASKAEFEQALKESTTLSLADLPEPYTAIYNSDLFPGPKLLELSAASVHTISQKYDPTKNYLAAAVAGLDVTVISNKEYGVDDHILKTQQKMRNLLSGKTERLPRINSRSRNSLIREVTDRVMLDAFERDRGLDGRVHHESMNFRVEAPSADTYDTVMIQPFLTSWPNSYRNKWERKIKGADGGEATEESFVSYIVPEYILLSKALRTLKDGGMLFVSGTSDEAENPITLKALDYFTRVLAPKNFQLERVRDLDLEGSAKGIFYRVKKLDNILNIPDLSKEFIDESLELTPYLSEKLRINLVKKLEETAQSSSSVALIAADTDKSYWWNRMHPRQIKIDDLTYDSGESSLQELISHNEKAERHLDWVRFEVLLKLRELTRSMGESAKATQHAWARQKIEFLIAQVDRVLGSDDPFEKFKEIKEGLSGIQEKVNQSFHADREIDHIILNESLIFARLRAGDMPRGAYQYSNFVHRIASLRVWNGESGGALVSRKTVLEVWPVSDVLVKTLNVLGMKATSVNKVSDAKNETYDITLSEKFMTREGVAEVARFIDVLALMARLTKPGGISIQAVGDRFKVSEETLSKAGFQLVSREGSLLVLRRLNDSKQGARLTIQEPGKKVPAGVVETIRSSKDLELLGYISAIEYGSRVINELNEKALSKLRTAEESTGTGDAFAAGVIYGLKHKFSLAETVALATVLGGASFVHQGGGTVGGDRKKIFELLNKTRTYLLKNVKTSSFSRKEIVAAAKLADAYYDEDQKKWLNVSYETHINDELTEVLTSLLIAAIISLKHKSRVSSEESTVRIFYKDVLSSEIDIDLLSEVHAEDDLREYRKLIKDMLSTLGLAPRRGTRFEVFRAPDSANIYFYPAPYHSSMSRSAARLAQGRPFNAMTSKTRTVLKPSTPLGARLADEESKWSVRLLRANDLNKEKKFAEAAEEFEKLLSEIPGIKNTHSKNILNMIISYHAGYNFFDLGQYERAHALADQSILSAKQAADREDVDVIRYTFASKKLLISIAEKLEDVSEILTTTEGFLKYAASQNKNKISKAVENSEWEIGLEKLTRAKALMGYFGKRAINKKELEEALELIESSAGFAEKALGPYTKAAGEINEIRADILLYLTLFTPYWARWLLDKAQKGELSGPKNEVKSSAEKATILTRLSNHYWNKGQYTNAIYLARSAYELSQHPAPAFLLSIVYLDRFKSIKQPVTEDLNLSKEWLDKALEAIKKADLEVPFAARYFEGLLHFYAEEYEGYERALQSWGEELNGTTLEKAAGYSVHLIHDWLLSVNRVYFLPASLDHIVRILFEGIKGADQMAVASYLIRHSAIFSDFDKIFWRVAEKDPNTALIFFNNFFLALAQHWQRTEEDDPRKDIYKRTIRLILRPEYLESILKISAEQKTDVAWNFLAEFFTNLSMIWAGIPDIEKEERAAHERALDQMIAFSVSKDYLSSKQQWTSLTRGSPVLKAGVPVLFGPKFLGKLNFEEKLALLAEWTEDLAGHNGYQFEAAAIGEFLKNVQVQVITPLNGNGMVINERISKNLKRLSDGIKKAEKNIKREKNILVGSTPYFVWIGEASRMIDLKLGARLAGSRFQEGWMRFDGDQGQAGFLLKVTRRFANSSGYGYRADVYLDGADHAPKGYVTFTDTDKFIDITLFFPLGKRIIPGTSEFQGKGVARRIVAWLASIALKSGAEIRIEETFSPVLIHISEQLFADEMSVNNGPWKDLKEMKRPGFYDRNNIGSLYLQSLEDDNVVHEVVLAHESGAGYRILESNHWSFSNKPLTILENGLVKFEGEVAPSWKFVLFDRPILVKGGPKSQTVQKFLPISPTFIRHAAVSAARLSEKSRFVPIAWNELRQALEATDRPDKENQWEKKITSVYLRLPGKQEFIKLENPPTWFSLEKILWYIGWQAVLGWTDFGQREALRLTQNNRKNLDLIASYALASIPEGYYRYKEGIRGADYFFDVIEYRAADQGNGSGHIGTPLMVPTALGARLTKDKSLRPILTESYSSKDIDELLSRPLSGGTVPMSQAGWKYSVFLKIEEHIKQKISPLIKERIVSLGGHADSEASRILMRHLPHFFAIAYENAIDSYLQLREMFGFDEMPDLDPLLNVDFFIRFEGEKIYLDMASTGISLDFAEKTPEKDSINKEVILLGNKNYRYRRLGGEGAGKDKMSRLIASMKPVVAGWRLLDRRDILDKNMPGAIVEMELNRSAFTSAARLSMEKKFKSDDEIADFVRRSGEIILSEPKGLAFKDMNKVLSEVHLENNDTFGIISREMSGGFEEELLLLNVGVEPVLTDKPTHLLVSYKGTVDYIISNTKYYWKENQKIVAIVRLKNPPKKSIALASSGARLTDKESKLGARLATDPVLTLLTGKTHSPNYEELLELRNETIVVLAQQMFSYIFSNPALRTDSNDPEIVMSILEAGPDYILHLHFEKLFNSEGSLNSINFRIDPETGHLDRPMVETTSTRLRGDILQGEYILLNEFLSEEFVDIFNGAANDLARVRGWKLKDLIQGIKEGKYRDIREHELWAGYYGEQPLNIYHIFHRYAPKAAITQAAGRSITYRKISESIFDKTKKLGELKISSARLAGYGDRDDKLKEDIDRAAPDQMVIISGEPMLKYDEGFLGFTRPDEDHIVWSDGRAGGVRVIFYPKERAVEMVVPADSEIFKVTIPDGIKIRQETDKALVTYKGKTTEYEGRILDGIGWDPTRDLLVVNFYQDLESDKDLPRISSAGYGTGFILVPWNIRRGEKYSLPTGWNTNLQGSRLVGSQKSVARSQENQESLRGARSAKKPAKAGLGLLRHGANAPTLAMTYPISTAHFVNANVRHDTFTFLLNVSADGRFGTIAIGDSVYKTEISGKDLKIYGIAASRRGNSTAIRIRNFEQYLVQGRRREKTKVLAVPATVVSGQSNLAAQSFELDQKASQINSKLDTILNIKDRAVMEFDLSALGTKNINHPVFSYLLQAFYRHRKNALLVLNGDPVLVESVIRMAVEKFKSEKLVFKSTKETGFPAEFHDAKIILVSGVTKNDISSIRKGKRNFIMNRLDINAQFYDLDLNIKMALAKARIGELVASNPQFQTYLEAERLLWDGNSPFDMAEYIRVSNGDVSAGDILTVLKYAVQPQLVSASLLLRLYRLREQMSAQSA